MWNIFNNIAKIRTYVTLVQGAKVSELRTFTEEDVKTFARLTGDLNPVHFGDGGIVHGVLINGLVSSILGTRLPGPGYVVVHQNMDFPNPLPVGQTIRIAVELTQARKIMECAYTCTTVDSDKIVHKGIAKLIKPSHSKS